MATTFHLRSGLMLSFLTIGGTALAAQPNDYPSRPIHLVVPFAAGGPVDIMARVLGTGLSDYLGQPIVVENKDGAAGTIGTAYTAKSKPDGYTIVLGSPSALVFAPLIYGDRLPYNVQRDLVPISLVGRDAFVVIVSAPLKISTLSDLVAQARKEPGKLHYGSPGQGSPIHLAGLFLEKLAGIKMTHVPYRGAGPAMRDVMTGTIQMTFPTVSGAMSFLQGGKVKAIAIMAPQRSKAIPNIPTTAEQGYPNFLGTSWNGLLAPKDTPMPIIAKLTTATVATLKMPDVQKFLSSHNIEPVGGDSAGFAKVIAADTARWAPMIKAAGIRPN